MVWQCLPEMNCNGCRAHYRLQSTRAATLPCGIPLHKFHQRTPSKKELKCSPIGKDTRLLRYMTEKIINLNSTFIFCAPVDEHPESQ